MTYRIEGIELEELPELWEPEALAIIKPWIDVNNVASGVLSHLEGLLGGRELGRLIRPGEFFDFTRYRPRIYFEEGVRKVQIPNIKISFARRNEGEWPDLLFLHLLEPHMAGEAFVDAILAVLKELKVKRYLLLGSMFDAVPHTRPLLVSGGAIGAEAEQLLKGAGVEPSDYEGPTTIAFLINQLAPEMGIESLWAIVSLPMYLQLEEDHLGVLRLVEVLASIYGLPIPEELVARAEEQRRNLDRALEVKPELEEVVAKLEEFYDERVRGEGPRSQRLSPEFEQFLREISRDLGGEGE